MSGSISKIPILIITLVVGFIMVTTAVLPLAADYSEAKKFTNEGEFELTYTQTEEITLNWDHTKPSIIIVNDEDVNMPQLSNGQQRTILCGEDWILRFGYGTSLGGYFVQYYPSSGAAILASEGNGLDLSITCFGGTASVTDTASTPNTATAAYSSLYCASNDGDYVMKKSTDAAFMRGDSEFYAMGLTVVGTYTSIGIKVTGNISDGATWEIFRGGEGFTFTDQEINYSTVSGYNNLYKLESMTATVSKEEQSADAVYSYFIVPAEISAEPDNPDTFKNMVRIVPLIALVALVAAAAGMIYFKGKE